MVAHVASILRSMPALLVPNFLRKDETYSLTEFKSDCIAGITVTIILVPQAMALALIAGLPAVYGLYAALPGFIASLWGSSKHLSTGPVALVSFLTFTSLLPLATPNTLEFITLAATLALLVGIIQLLMGLFRFGFIMQLIPHSAIVGFTSAAAAIIVVGQLPTLLGISVPQHEFVYQNILALAAALPSVSPETFLLGFVAISLLVAFRRLPKTFPGTLIVLMLAGLATYFFDLASHGIALVQAVPAALPTFHFPTSAFSDVFILLPKAAVIAFIGFVEAHAIAKSIAAKQGQHLDTNQELVGQGLANIVAGVFRGFPVSGSFLRTAVNVQAGAKTRYASVVTALGTVFVILFFAPLLSLLPRAVLSAIVIISASGMIAIGRIKKMYMTFPGDGIVALATFGLAFLLKPDDALFIGIVLALVIFVRQTVWGVKVKQMAIDKDWNVLRDIKNAINMEELPGTLIVRPGMPMYYANTEHIMDEINEIINEKTATAPIQRIVIDFSAVHLIDITGVEVLGDHIRDFETEGIQVAAIYIRKSLAESLETVSDFPKITKLRNIAQMREWCGMK